MSQTAATDDEMAALTSVQVGPEAKGKRKNKQIFANVFFTAAACVLSHRIQFAACRRGVLQWQPGALHLLPGACPLSMRRPAINNRGAGTGKRAAKHSRNFGLRHRQGEQRLQKVSVKRIPCCCLISLPFPYSNTFLSNILNYQRKVEQRKAKPKATAPDQLDFLHDVQQPQEGFAHISHICQQLPSEWCVLQLCKSFNPATSYSTFCDIAASKGDIYLSLLSHCRSPELPATCLSFNNDALANIFKEYSTLVERFRRVVTVDPLAVKTQEAKAKYWKELNGFGDSLRKLIAELASVFSPYCFLFLGKRYTSVEVDQLSKIIFQRVDQFCLEHSWSSHQRILLSQAALHANRVPHDELNQISYELSNTKKTTEVQLVYELLKSCANDWEQLELSQLLAVKRFPIILVVDEASEAMSFGSCCIDCFRFSAWITCTGSSWRRCRSARASSRCTVCGASTSAIRRKYSMATTR